MTTPTTTTKSASRSSFAAPHFLLRHFYFLSVLSTSPFSFFDFPSTSLHPPSHHFDLLLSSRHPSFQQRRRHLNLPPPPFSFPFSTLPCFLSPSSHHFICCTTTPKKLHPHPHPQFHSTPLPDSTTLRQKQSKIQKSPLQLHLSCISHFSLLSFALTSLDQPTHQPTKHLRNSFSVRPDPPTQNVFLDYSFLVLFLVLSLSSPSPSTVIISICYPFPTHNSFDVRPFDPGRQSDFDPSPPLIALLFFLASCIETIFILSVT